MDSAHMSEHGWICIWHVHIPNCHLHFFLIVSEYILASKGSSYSMWQRMPNYWCHAPLNYKHTECLIRKYNARLWNDKVVRYNRPCELCVHLLCRGRLDGEFQKSETGCAGELHQRRWTGTLTTRLPVDRRAIRGYIPHNAMPNTLNLHACAFNIMTDICSLHVQDKALMRPTTSMNTVGPCIAKSTEERKLTCSIQFICCIIYDVNVGPKLVVDVALMMGVMCARIWMRLKKPHCGLWKCICGRKHALQPILNEWLLQLSMLTSTCFRRQECKG